MACAMKMSLIVTLPPTTNLDNFSILATASVDELDLRFTMSRALETRLTLNKLSMSCMPSLVCPHCSCRYHLHHTPGESSSFCWAYCLPSRQSVASCPAAAAPQLQVLGQQLLTQSVLHWGLFFYVCLPLLVFDVVQECLEDGANLSDLILHETFISKV